MFLTDRQILDALYRGDISIKIKDGAGEDVAIQLPSHSQLRQFPLIQASSLDLTVGEIFVPSKELYEQGKVPFETGHRLEPGETAVVETREYIALGKNIGAFGFPPAGVSRNSILMTNPGHVDPGYSGRLSFTLINMGRMAFSLRQGERIASLLIFRLSENVVLGYSERYPPKVGASQRERDWAKLLNQLSPDFGSVQQRIKDEAAKAVSVELKSFEDTLNGHKVEMQKHEKTIEEAKGKLSRANLVIPTIGAVVSAAAAIFAVTAGYVREPRFDNLSSRVQTLETQTKSGDLQRIIADLTTRLENLERAAPSQEPMSDRP